MEIEGFSNYLIYDDGRVWSKTSKKFLKSHITNGGYYRIGLTKNKKPKFFLIHRLIALHYIDNPNGYETVDHIDINTLNNNISNLRWATQSMQNQNKNAHSNTGEKYIFIQTIRHYKYYSIQKNNCFRTSLRCDKYSLQDAINLRDSLLIE